MRVLILSLLLIPALASAQIPQGIAGHIKVEAQVKGRWVELYQPSFSLAPARRTLSVPAEMAEGGKLSLRLSAPDNDETQIDAVGLQGGRLLSAKDSLGADLMKKFIRADHDVAEIHGDPVLVQLQAPKGGRDLVLTLDGRSSNNASIPKAPFRLGAWALARPVCSPDGRICLEPQDGASTKIATSPQPSGSGHPAAPLLGSLKVEKGALLGHLDFGPDNDPGDDDYASVLAYDAKGLAHEFKVTPLDTRYGRARWAYSSNVRWQHMVFDLSIPLAQVPRDAAGKLSLELLAYGTCATVNSGPGARFSGGIGLAATFSQPTNLTWTVTPNLAVAGPGPSANYLTVTSWLLDPNGITVSTQTAYTALIAFACSPYPASTFFYTPLCDGTYTVYATVQGQSDANPLTLSSASTTVSGSSACATLTPTPTSTASPTASATPSATPSATASPTPGGTTAATSTPGIGGQTTAPQVGVTTTKKGGTLYIVFPALPAQADITVYNLAGQRVAVFSASGSNPAWQTGDAAPGLYLFKIKATLSDGSTVDTWKRGMIQP